MFVFLTYFCYIVVAPGLLALPLALALAGISRIALASIFAIALASRPGR